MEQVIRQAVVFSQEERYVKALGVLYDWMFEHFRDRNFESVNRLLLRLSENPLPTKVNIGLLSVTKPLKTELPQREQFFQACCQQAQRENYENDLLTPFQ